MRALGSFVQSLVAAMVCVWGSVDRIDVAAQLVRDDHRDNNLVEIPFVSWVGPVTIVGLKQLGSPVQIALSRRSNMTKMRSDGPPTCAWKAR